MTDRGFRFCPRCGTALVAGLPYCPKCGFNVAEIGAAREPAEGSPPRPADAVERERNVEPFERGMSRAPIILVAVVIAAALAGFLLLTRPQGVTGPTPGSPGVPNTGGSDGAVASLAPSAPIVGLTIQSPPDGQVVATKEVTVIGLAPPGLTVTRDVSFGLDQHATADGTGHWAINVGLQEGQNDLVFRMGDDRSTEKRLRVTFTPPPQ